MAKLENKKPPTPANIAKIATEPAKLGQTTLIGIFGMPSRLNALIRKSNGKITKVSIGDHFNGGTVEAIDENSQILSQHGKSTVMTLPKT